MSAPDDAEQLEHRALAAASRIERIGIPRRDLARLAGVDRGTLGRALKADPRTLANGARTWVLIERELDRLEHEIANGARRPSESDEHIEATVEYCGARITLSGPPNAVAEAIRKVLEG